MTNNQSNQSPEAVNQGGKDLPTPLAFLIVAFVIVIMGVYLGRVIESINMLDECDKQKHYEFSSMIFVKPIAIECKVKP